MSMETRQRTPSAIYRGNYRPQYNIQQHLINTVLYIFTMFTAFLRCLLHWLHAGVGSGSNAKTYMLAWSVIGGLMVRTSPLPFALIRVDNRQLCVTDFLQPVLVQQRTCRVVSCACDSACKRSLAVCRKSRHCVLLAGFCLSLYSLHVLNRDVNMIQTKLIVCNLTNLANWTM